MGEAENNLNIFINSENEFSQFEKMSNDEVGAFCLTQTDSIVKKLRLYELNESQNFRSELQSTLHKIKLTLYFFENLDNPKSRIFINSMNNLRGQIKKNFGNTYSDLITWHEPNRLDKFFRETKFENDISFPPFSSMKKTSNYDTDIFKSKDTYLNTIKYINESVVETIPDLSYLFQKLLDLKLIHKKTHKEYKEWLFKNELIKEQEYNLFMDRGSFDSLKNLQSAKRRKDFNRIFDINEKF